MTSVAPPSLRSPLRRYLAEQRTTDRALAKILLASARDAEERILALAGKQGVGAVVQRAQLRLVIKELQTEAVRLWPAVEREIRDGMARSVVAAAEAHNSLTQVLWNAAGVGNALESSVIAQAKSGLEALYSRSANGIPLSRQVFRTSVGAQGLVQARINQALARGASWKELAGDVRGLINPRVAGGVSYAAERLARSELNNAFHTTQKRLAEPNPFIEGMHWWLSGSHPKPDECNAFAEDDHDNLGRGIFKKQNVPGKPHAQCFCYLTPETDDEEEFVRKFQQGQYDEYLDELVEELPIPDLALLERNTDDLGQFVLQGRQEGKSWARIAQEAKQRGLATTDSPGAMRAVARKHGITDTGSLKKTQRTIKEPPRPAPRPTVEVPKSAAPRPAPTPTGVVRQEIKDRFVNYGKYDSDHLDRLMGKYQDLVDEYRFGVRKRPIVQGQLNARLRGIYHDGVNGLYDGSIWLDGEKFSADQLRLYRARRVLQERAGSKVPTATADKDIATFVHEFGHHIQRQIPTRDWDKLFRDLFNSLEGKDPNLIPRSYQSLAEDISSSYLKGTDAWYTQIYGRVIERFNIEVRNGVSTYGSTNWQEFVAECFAEYKLNPSPRPIARLVGRFIDKELKGG